MAFAGRLGAHNKHVEKLFILPQAANEQVVVIRSIASSLSHLSNAPLVEISRVSPQLDNGASDDGNGGQACADDSVYSGWAIALGWLWHAGNSDRWGALPELT
jgi:hypothetical protein